ncbi:MAG: hypothetical protein ABEK36_03095 [Candidatus Aenigmatarchaeota archaeon]
MRKDKGLILGFSLQTILLVIGLAIAIIIAVSVRTEGMEAIKTMLNPSKWLQFAK